MALSLPEHLATRETAGHRKMRVTCRYFSCSRAAGEIHARRFRRRYSESTVGCLLRGFVKNTKIRNRIVSGNGRYLQGVS